MIQDQMFPFIENVLSWTAKRQQALSSNIANMDTPGYVAKDYSFREQLSGMAMASTSESHIAIQSESTVQMVKMDAPMKKNGNSVDLEQNMTELTKNALQYITLVQYLNQRLKTLRSSITEGGRV
jgi:flagellar basal-body rod protein FlgB